MYKPDAGLRSLALIAALTILAQPAQSQDAPQRWTGVLEEIIVTATRVETSLQQTPMSIRAFSGEDLELGGIDRGGKLGIMVPNVAISPNPFGEFRSEMIIRGLPGVATYIDGIGFGTLAFQQRNFLGLERVEVLRGPQGTNFGRNSNGGAIQLITREPAEAFGARVNMELGEFDQRTLNVAMDVPLSDRLKTKWTGALDRNDGFLESRAGPFTLGGRDNWLLRADILWQPTDRFSLRFSANEEHMHSSDARIVRIPDPNVRELIAYNVLAGNPDYLAQARALDPSFPDPPFSLDTDRFTAETHEPGFPGGSLERWQTRSETPGPTAVVEQQWVTLTLNWDITERLSLESLTSFGDSYTQRVGDLDGSEFTRVHQLDRNYTDGVSQELHLTGAHLDGRLRYLLGLYYDQGSGKFREASWNLWEFAIPNTGPGRGLPGPPGEDGRPLLNLAAVDYVRAWGATVGNPVAANFFPVTFPTRDTLARGEGVDRALFGELTIGLLDRLDLTLGFRFSDSDGSFAELVPAEAFRSTVPGEVLPGDPHAAAAVIFAGDAPELATVSTPRVSIAYQPTDEIYLYASYAEGFTSGEVIRHPLLPDPIELDPEVVKTREIGLRSEWLGARLRLNATYFDSRWDGLRVPRTLSDPNNPGQTLPFQVSTDSGLAKATGLEVELSYLVGERWALDAALGLLDTEYLDIGEPPANGTGLQPGIPFAYAPELSYSLGLRYRLPLAGRGELLFAANYGWMDDYERNSPSQFQTKDPDGSNKPEPGYGLLNARVVFQPAGRNWELSLFGTNLTDEWYVDGGFAPSLDVATVGRPRELGVGLRFVFE